VKAEASLRRRPSRFKVIRMSMIPYTRHALFWEQVSMVSQVCLKHFRILRIEVIVVTSGQQTELNTAVSPEEHHEAPRRGQATFLHRARMTPALISVVYSVAQRCSREQEQNSVSRGQ
jgi:hypothetical protein